MEQLFICCTFAVLMMAAAIFFGLAKEHRKPR